MTRCNATTREGYEFWDKICSLKHYGFIHSPDNSRVLKAEGIGNWIDKFEAQAIVSDAQDQINVLKEQRDQLLNALKCIADYTRNDGDCLAQHVFSVAREAITISRGAV